MIETILLPLDESPLSERALCYAISLASRSGAKLLLLEAVQAHNTIVEDAGEAQVNTIEHAETYLKSIVVRAAARGVTAEPHVYYDEPVRAILDAAERNGADVIVMSTHGRGGLGRLIYGSVADQVLRRSNVPVLLVPAMVEHIWPAEGPHALLVPLDGSPLAEQALQAASLLTEGQSSQLILLRVVQPPSPGVYGEGYAYIPYDEEAEVAEARRYLQEQADRLSAAGQDVGIRVSVGQPTLRIGEVARACGADVIVMATHGLGGFSRLLLGSAATGTLAHTTVPLLLTRPAAAQAGAQPAETDEQNGSLAPASTACTDDCVEGPLITVRLSPSDLELIEQSLKALGPSPKCNDDDHVQAARALAERLKQPV